MRLRSIIKQLILWWETSVSETPINDTSVNETPLQEQIRLTKKALRRYYGQIDYMNRQWSGLCCPACQWGAPYDDMLDKIDRVEAWLKILEEKEVKQSNIKGAQTE